MVRKERLQRILRVLSIFMSGKDLLQIPPEELEKRFYELISSPVEIEKAYLERWKKDERLRKSSKSVK